MISGSRIAARAWLPFHLSALCLLLGSSVAAQTAVNHAQVLDHEHRAQAALAQGDTEAMGEYRAILRLEPANTPAIANLGALAYKAGQFGEAKTLLQRALQQQPNLWDAKALLGLTEAGLGNTAAAIPELQDAFPHIHDHGVKLDAGLTLLGLRQQNRTLGEAAAVIHELELAAPENPEVLYTVYHAYSELAGSALEALRTHAADSGRFHQVLAEVALAQDDFPGAIAEFRKAIAAQPELPGVHLKLGETLLINAKDAPTRAEAQREFETELQRNPRDFRSEYELGEVERLGGDNARAESHYKRALTLNPAYPEAEEALGTLLAQEQRFAEALPLCEDASRLDPQNETYHYRLARLYEAMKRPDDSHREMEIFRQLHKP